MTDGEWNIDLSYICQDRIIVMSYPSEGKEALYRNNAVDVSILQSGFNFVPF